MQAAQVMLPFIAVEDRSSGTLRDGHEIKRQDGYLPVSIVAASRSAQQRLYFLPEPQGHGALRAGRGPLGPGRSARGWSKRPRTSS